MPWYDRGTGSGAEILELFGSIDFDPEYDHKKGRSRRGRSSSIRRSGPWRSVGSVGLNRIYTFENDTGPDDANHAQNGVLILYDPRQQDGRILEDMHLMDVAPTILDRLGEPVPEGMQGKIIC